MYRYFRFVLLLITTSLAAQSNSDSSTIIQLIDEARAYFYKDPNQSLLLARKAYAAAENSINDRLKSKALNTVGSAYYFIGNGDSALHYHSRALEIQLAINDIEGQGRSYTNIGGIYGDRGWREKALASYIQAEQRFEQCGFKIGLAKLYNSLGILYQDMQDYTNSIYYLNKGKRLAEEMQDPVALCSVTNNLANCYDAQSKHSLAAYYYLKAYALAKADSNYKDIASIANNLCLQYLFMGNMPEARRFSKDALNNIYEHQLYGYYKISAYAGLGLILDKEHNYKAARSAFDSSLKYVELDGTTEQKIDVCDRLAAMCFRNSDPQSAYTYLRISKQISDSLYEANLTNKVNEINAAYNLDKKEQQINVLTLEKETEQKLKWFLILIIGLSSIFLLLAIWSYLRKRRDNQIIHEQQKETERQKKIIEVKQKEVLDSIHYAQRIQRSLLASDENLKSGLKDFFIYYNPKDIVSGDFYWCTQKDQRFYLLVGDSTGHGVPGAFMSLLNITFLNEAINEKNIESPGEILDYVRGKLIQNISQEGARDGMDACLLCFTGNILEYANAQQKPVLFRQGEKLELQQDKMPIGKSERDTTPFNTYSMEVYPGDQLYVFTDGFYDQFGGKDGKKLKHKHLVDYLSAIVRYPSEKQQELLEYFFLDWKGQLEQIDDVTLVGIHIK